LNVLSALGPAGLRRREDAKADEQRARGITFSVAGEAATRLFPFDLVPRIVAAADREQLETGLIQRVKALDAFVNDVYNERAVVRDGIVPEWVIDGSPELRPSGALVRRPGRAGPGGRRRPGARHRGQLVRAGGQPAGALRDRLRDAEPAADRGRAARAAPPGRSAQPEGTPALLKRALLDAAGPSAGDDPQIVVLSQGPDDSAWFEHRMLAEEMGVPLVRSTELLVDEATGLPAAERPQEPGRRDLSADG
jgi:carboxylate-amine ligase